MRLRRVRVVPVLAIAGAVTAGLVACTPYSDSRGSIEDGSARFTVTYRTDPGSDPVSVEVTMEGTDCYIDSVGTHFGADVGPEARAAHLEDVADDVAAPLGFSAGAVSGLVEDDRAQISVVLPEGLVFVSRQTFEMTDGAFEVTDLPGTMQRSARTGVVHEDATATGSFTCGRTTRLGR